jgi:hypothetical protein
MSSIEDVEPTDDVASAFFSGKLVPLARENRRSTRQVELRPDPAAETYFRDRAKTSMSLADFELVGTESIEAFRGALARHWASVGHPELAALAEDFAALAAALYKADQQSDELSPFIYVMF